MSNNNNTIRVEVEPTLMNPEEYFNDLIEDGVSVHDALMTIMEDELVYAEVNRMFPNGEMSIGDSEDLGGGVHEIVLEKTEWN